MKTTINLNEFITISFPESIFSYYKDYDGNQHKRKSGDLISTHVNKNGYLYFSGSPLHRIIYKVLFGEIPEGMEIDHIDGNKTNNHLSNLRLVTSQQNKLNARLSNSFKYKISSPGKCCFELGFVPDQFLHYFKSPTITKNGYIRYTSKVLLINEAEILFNEIKKFIKTELNNIPNFLQVLNAPK